MNSWKTYPPDYRVEEVNTITSAVRGGACVALVGLSGSGKSNLLTFLTKHQPNDCPEFVMVDCNRLEDYSSLALFQLINGALGKTNEPQNDLVALDNAIADFLGSSSAGICLLFDRFDLLATKASPALFGNLRALRDTHKYALTYVTATRRPLDPATELAELFFAHTLWLGPLSERNSRWSVLSFAERAGYVWDDKTVNRLVTLTSGYPALLRAACEAYADGCSLQVSALVKHPAIHKRVTEFWMDEPGERELRLSGLLGQPLLLSERSEGMALPAQKDNELTAKEHLLMAYFHDHQGIVCEKDELIRAVWPEDHIFERGVRDDSLAQLVRRLRRKIEADPSQPRYIKTVPGRGYRYLPGK